MPIDAVARRCADKTSAVEDADVGKNKRWADRRATRQLARIVMGENANGIKCTISDLSSGGAKLALDRSGTKGTVSSEYLPDTFQLYMPYDRAQVNCKIAWRNGMQIGVRFTSPIKVISRAPRPDRQPAKKEPNSLLGKIFCR